MSRLMNKLRAGFYATPKIEGEYLINLLDVKGSGVFFDPMCGEGEILHQITSAFQNDDCHITSYGVELDKSRAEKARQILDHCINAPIESMVISNNAASLLYLNPPYDFTMKSIEDDQAERKEYRELVRNTRFLKEKGLMIYVIPSYRFSDEKIARFLATNFEDVGIVRFSDENFDDYNQCVFIGNKRSGQFKQLNQKLYHFLLNMKDRKFVLENVTPIDIMQNYKKWIVPPGVTELKTFYTRLEDKTKYYEGILSSKGFKAFKERSKPNRLVIGGNPCLPINQGQMALLLASGAVNGEIGEEDQYHLVQGLEIVSKIQEVEQIIHDNGTKTTITKERTKRDVSVKIITPSGLVRKLV